MTWIAAILVIGIVGGFLLQRRRGQSESKDYLWPAVTALSAILLAFLAVRHADNRYFFAVLAVALAAMAVWGIVSQKRSG